MTWDVETWASLAAGFAALALAAGLAATARALRRALRTERAALAALHAGLETRLRQLATEREAAGPEVAAGWTALAAGLRDDVDMMFTYVARLGDDHRAQTERILERLEARRSPDDDAEGAWRGEALARIEAIQADLPALRDGLGALSRAAAEAASDGDALREAAAAAEARADGRAEGIETRLDRMEAGLAALGPGLHATVAQATARLAPEAAVTEGFGRLSIALAARDAQQARDLAAQAAAVERLATALADRDLRADGDPEAKAALERWAGDLAARDARRDADLAAREGRLAAGFAILDRRLTPEALRAALADAAPGEVTARLATLERGVAQAVEAAEMVRVAAEATAARVAEVIAAAELARPAAGPPPMAALLASGRVVDLDAARLGRP